MEIRLGPVQLLDPHIIGKPSVETVMKIARTPGVRGLERDLLANGVDAGIGTPGGEDAPLGRQAWLRFVMPLMIKVGIVGSLVLVVAVLIGYE